MIKAIVNKNSNRFYICVNTLFHYKWRKVIPPGTRVLEGCDTISYLSNHWRIQGGQGGPRGPPQIIIIIIEACVGTDTNARVLSEVSEIMLSAVSNISTGDVSSSLTISVCVHPWHHRVLKGALIKISGGFIKTLSLHRHSAEAATPSK